MGGVYKRTRSIMEWKAPLYLEKYVWWKGGLILLSELRAVFAEKLQALKTPTLPTGTSTGSDVLVFPATRPDVSGEPTMNEDLRPEFDASRTYKPFEPHVAESKWQFCNCLSCQNKRATIDALPGKPIDYNVYRHKDEKY